MKCQLQLWVGENLLSSMQWFDLQGDPGPSTPSPLVHVGPATLRGLRPVYTWWFSVNRGKSGGSIKSEGLTYLQTYRHAALHDLLDVLIFVSDNIKRIMKTEEKRFPKTNALQSWHICFQFLWESEETCKKRQFHLWNIFCLTLSSREERQMSKQGHNPKDLSRFWQRFVKQGKYCRNEMCALGESVKVTESEPGKKQHYS